MTYIHSYTQLTRHITIFENNLKPVSFKLFINEKCELFLITIIGKSYSFFTDVSITENHKVKNLSYDL